MALDHAFDAGTLHDLREAVLAEAVAAGMPGDRAVDVMLVVHELAANAVCHGAGTGQLRMRVLAGQLHCQVTDAGHAAGDGWVRAAGTDAGQPWPVQRGHGLWLVQAAADEISVTSGPAGSRVTAIFTMPPSGSDPERSQGHG